MNLFVHCAQIAQALSCQKSHLTYKPLITMGKYLKIMLLVIASVLSVNMAAQNQWSVLAGLLKSDNKGSYSGESVTITTNDYGFYAGAGLDFPIEGVRNMYFEGQLVYSYLEALEGDSSENVHALNLPLRAKYKVDLSDKFGIFAYGGPVTSLGLAGKSKVKNTTYSVYGKDGFLNRLDFKLGIGGGIELCHKVVISVGYDWGLLNISRNHSVNMRLNLLHIGVAYNI